MIQVNPKFELIQTRIHQININHLFEKSPIIIQDRIVTPYSLTDTLFKYLYVSKKEWIFRNKIFNPYQKNGSKYMIIYASSPISMQVIHPNEYNQGQPINILSLNLKKNQVFILPLFWWYSIKGDAFVIELNSISSSIMKIFG